MPNTANLSMPLVMPAQAQKHVTVNEALAILDTVTQLGVIDSTRVVPPSTGLDGDAYIVPADAQGTWANRTANVAVWSNGGWSFLMPRAGWKAWDKRQCGWQIYDGTVWIPDAQAISPGGAALTARIVEIDHPITAGATSKTAALIPGGAQVIGVSARVTSAIKGVGLTGWRIGVEGSDSRYGSGLGMGLNAYTSVISATPVTYYSRTSLVLTAEGKPFSAGNVRIAAHIVEISPPRPV